MDEGKEPSETFNEGLILPRSMLRSRKSERFRVN